MPAPRPLLFTADALKRVLEGAEILGIEKTSISQSLGRTLSQTVLASRAQPPFRASAMDGYAVRSVDAIAGARLRVVGEAAAGHLFEGTLRAGDAVRIFTGGAVPDGADTVILQENTSRQGDEVLIEQSAEHGRHIRAAGNDFNEGDTLLTPGIVLTPRDISIAASTGHAALEVARKPRIAVLATGDELVLPGEVPGPAQIISSNNFMISALIEANGGTALDLGLIRDDMDSLHKAISGAMAQKADVIVTIGGASVGDHDLVQKALIAEGMELDFWRVAMRPGRPIMSGRIGATRVLGLPGNPTSAHIAATLFLVPLMRALLGRNQIEHQTEAALLGTDLAANDWRADHLRAKLLIRDDGLPIATPFSRQDSSMTRVLAGADCIILRPPEDEARKAGDLCRIIRLGLSL